MLVKYKYITLFIYIDQQAGMDVTYAEEVRLILYTLTYTLGGEIKIVGLQVGNLLFCMQQLINSGSNLSFLDDR